MKPVSLPRLLIRAFWFGTLIIGIFYVIERLQGQEERQLLSQRTFMPDTARSVEVFFAQVPDTFSFADEEVLVQGPVLREALREAYYKWSLSPATYVGMLQHGYRWQPWITTALIRAGLPTDFAYAAASRSGWNLQLTGEKAGLWALDAATARQANLQVNKQIDERLDPFLSTQAVAHQLHLTQKKTGSWIAALRDFCGSTPNCFADVLVLSQLLAFPERYGYGFPLRHRTPPLRFCEEPLQVSYPTVGTFLQQRGVDSTLFIYYNPFLLDLSMPLQAGQKLYLPLQLAP